MRMRAYPLVLANYYGYFIKNTAVSEPAGTLQDETRGTCIIAESILNRAEETIVKAHTA